MRMRCDFNWIHYLPRCVLLLFNLFSQIRHADLNPTNWIFIFKYHLLFNSIWNLFENKLENCANCCENCADRWWCSSQSVYLLIFRLHEDALARVQFMWFAYIGCIIGEWVYICGPRQPSKLQRVSVSSPEIPSNCLTVPHFWQCSNLLMIYNGSGRARISAQSNALLASQKLLSQTLYSLIHGQTCLNKVEHPVCQTARYCSSVGKFRAPLREWDSEERMHLKTEIFTRLAPSMWICELKCYLYSTTIGSLREAYSTWIQCVLHIAMLNRWFWWMSNTV